MAAAATGKQYESESAAEQHYVIEHTMVGMPQSQRDDPLLSQHIDAPFFLRGDIVPASLLGLQIKRHLRLHAIREATTDETRSPDVRRAPRQSGNEDDALTAANSTVPAAGGALVAKTEDA